MERRTFLRGLFALPVAAVVGLPKLAEAASKVPYLRDENVWQAFPVTAQVGHDIRTQSYAIGFRVNYELLEDDQFDLVQRMADDCVDAIRREKELWRSDSTR